MNIAIDQSGRVEFTNVSTVVAYANGKQKSLLISAGEKRKLQAVFRAAGKPKMFAVKTFAILTFLLIRDDMERIDEITIDPEYPGNEWLVKQILVQLIRRYGGRLTNEDITFWSIGRQHNTHKRAIAVYRGNTAPDMIVTAKNVLPYIL